MSFFNLGRSKKTVISVVEHESSSTTSTSSGITKTSYQVKSHVTKNDRIDGILYNRSKSSPVNIESNSFQPIAPSTKAIETDSQVQGSSEIDDKFINLCLEKHNYYRNIHGVMPLKINKKLSEFSQEWANRLAKIGNMEHRKNSEYGENLYFKWSSNPKIVIGGDEAVTSWYDEIKSYDYSSGKSVSGLVTGHFTQVVWKDSTELGVGMARNSKGEIYVVCNYNPPGNFIGRHKENVLPSSRK